MNAKVDNAANDRFKGVNQAAVKNEGLDDSPCGLKTEHVAIHVEPAKRAVIMPLAIFMIVHDTRNPDGQDKEDHRGCGDPAENFGIIFHGLK
mgnify:CR=1 FL=1